MFRFIPACAGNTRWITRNRLLNTVHPRVCGEHLILSRTAKTFCGSSPRVRGTLREAAIITASSRFIPACAGNTLGGSCWPRRQPVHPRVCGEHAQMDAPTSRKNGSSPRVRGTPVIPKIMLCILRFIPACAGNTRRIFRHCEILPVHPRVCGEHLGVVLPCDTGAGSSPRVRGTLMGRGSGYAENRFIPACAGNTCCGPQGLPSRTVHPRVCGEHA